MVNRDRGPAEKGSRFCLQNAIREGSEVLNDSILTSSPSLLLFNPSIEWVSPLAAKGYLEHRDDILEILNMTDKEAALRTFWPKGGPQWDGLAALRGEGGAPGLLLVEAKAHPGEMMSDCKASPESLSQIEKTLARVQSHMGVMSVDWTKKYYQLANRLAYLYFFNEIAKVPTWLALINFVDDRSYKQTSLSAWRSHYAEVFRWLGVSDRSPLLEKLILAYPKGS
jgi:hypothetical protein